MPAIPIQPPASKPRHPRRIEPHPRSPSADDSSSFVADTSSRIRLRSEQASDPQDPEDDSESLIQPPPFHLPLSDDYPNSANPVLPRAYDASTLPPNHFLATHADSAIDSRQYFFALPLTYKGLNTGPSPGTVVGITLGSVLGFLILVWLANSIVNAPPSATRYIEGDSSEIVVTRRSGGSAKQRRRRTTNTRTRTQRSERTARTELSSQSASGGASVVSPPQPPRQPSPPRRTERIIREEVRVRTESRPPVPMPMPMPPPMPRPPPEMRETININIDERGGRPDRRVEGDDVVEVIEEHSDISQPAPPPNRRASRAAGAYRTVDPTAYGGGNFPTQKMRRPSGYAG